MDGFHYTRAQLDAFPDPKDAHYRRGAVDTFDADAWAELVHRLRNMRREETIDVPGFDHAVKDPEAGKIQIPGSSRIILFEGNYLMVSRMCSPYIPHLIPPLSSFAENHGQLLRVCSTSAY
jgi:pantothenate kinase